MTSQNRRPTMSANQTKYPQLRFKGFTDPWEQHKLGEVGKTQSGIGFPDAEQGGTEGVPFYKISDMNKPGNEHEMVNANNYVNYEQLSRKKWKIIETVPAVIFAKVGAAIMLNRKRLVTSPFLIDNNTMAYVFDGSWNIDFGKTLFETINLPRYAQVGALPSYNGSDIESIEVTLPNKGEQVKLGAFFKILDDTITLHQRKLDLLKEQKKGYLQKMFPKNGAKVPELRFAGFADAWEQRKLTEIVNRVNKSSNSDVLPKVEFEDIVSGEGRLNKDISSKLDSRKGTLFESENILYGKLRPYLKNWLFPDFEGVALGDFWVFEATDVSVPSFDYYLIQSDDYQKVANDTSGTKMPRSDWKNVSSTDFAIPSKDEQKQIGAFFKQLDDTITLHQRKLEKLQELKKGYLQKMFC